jgi:hypothetical protein
MRGRFSAAIPVSIRGLIPSTAAAVISCAMESASMGNARMYKPAMMVHVFAARIVSTY